MDMNYVIFWGLVTVVVIVGLYWIIIKAIDRFVSKISELITPKITAYTGYKGEWNSDDGSIARFYSNE